MHDIKSHYVVVGDFANYRESMENVENLNNIAMRSENKNSCTKCKFAVLYFYFKRFYQFKLYVYIFFSKLHNIYYC